MYTNSRSNDLDQPTRNMHRMRAHEAGKPEARAGSWNSLLERRSTAAWHMYDLPAESS